MTLRVVVVDDEPLPRERVTALVRATPGLELVGEARSGPAALDAIVALAPDLAFLDIELPELDAFELLEALGDAAPPAVIFVTAYDEYAIRAFDVSATDYLLKPVSAERFAAAVGRARERLARGEAPAQERLQPALAQLDRHRGGRRRFVVRRGTAHYFVRVDAVDWIDADGNYLRLHSEGRSHLVRHTMKAIEAELAGADFVRIHRSTLVNAARIAAVQPTGEGEYVVTLRDGTRLPSSRSYAPRLRALLR